LAGLVGIFWAAAPAWADRTPHPDTVEMLPSLPLEDVITITPTVGPVMNVAGSFYKSTPGVVPGAGTVLGQAISGATTLASHTKSFGDVYDQPIQVGLNFAYGLSNFDEAYLGIRWYHASGNQFPMFTSSSAVTWGGQSIPAGGTVYGQFSHYDEVGVDFGYHHYFDIPEWAGFHPYIGALLGMKRVDNVELTLRTASGVPIANDIHFYNGGLVADAGLTYGLRYDIDKLFALGIESGFRYEGPLSPNKTDFNGTGLAGMNSGGDRWDIPILVTMTAKFDLITNLLK
jgi:hypothetical protein